MFLDTKSVGDFIDNLRNINMKVASLKAIDDIKEISYEEKMYYEKLK